MGRSSWVSLGVFFFLGGDFAGSAGLLGVILGFRVLEVFFFWQGLALLFFGS